jgi:hypothetical protein
MFEDRSGDLSRENPFWIPQPCQRRAGWDLGPILQNNNVSFTMSDKSLASFLQTPSTLTLAYTFAA